MNDMERIDQLAREMIAFNRGDPMRVQHLIKVHRFAQLMGRMEHLDGHTQFITECAALVHDIGIHPAEEKYGACNGPLQEQEGPAYARALLEKLGLDKEPYTMVDTPPGHNVTQAAIDIIHCGDGDILMRGTLPTRDFLMPVLDRKNGLRTDRLMSHVSLASIPEYPKLLALSDMTIIVNPNPTQKKAIIKNTADALKAFGYENPKLALMALVENVNFHMPDTIEAQRLVTLINDILRLSELDEGGSLPTEPVELLSLCTDTVKSLESAAQQRQITMTVTGEAVTVSGVRRLLTETVFNLCDNAIKYNKDGGSVAVAVGRDGPDAVVTVADTGIGIPPEHQGRVFERFYRVDKSHSKASGGTGLGLSIVKHAVAYHHGTVTLDSREGEGTAFTLRLPLEA